MLVTIPSIAAALIIQSYIASRTLSLVLPCMPASATHTTQDELGVRIRGMIGEIQLRGFDVDLFEDMRGTTFSMRAVRPMGPSIVVQQGQVRVPLQPPQLTYVVD